MSANLNLNLNTKSLKTQVVVIAAALLPLTACTPNSDAGKTDTMAGTTTPAAQSAAQPVNGDATANKVGDAGTGDSRPADKDTHNKEGTSFPSVGSKGKETGSFPSAGKGAENPPAAQQNGETTASVPPTDRNGVVGSPMASNIDSKATANAGDNLDLSRYPYSARKQFKTDMETRLTAVNQGVGALEASKNKTVSEKNIDAIKKEEQSVSKKLDSADQQSAAQWSQYTENFRKDVLALEKSYREMSTTVQ